MTSLRGLAVRPTLFFLASLLIPFPTPTSAQVLPGQRGSLVEERGPRGDTVVVRVLSGSVWPGPATLVEELTIGALEGSEVETFGMVVLIAADREGGVYVFDGQVPALRYFDAQGRYVRTLGREGEGPGEYKDMLLGLAVRRDGRLMVRDPRNGRLTLYQPDGTPSEHWHFPSNLFHLPQALVLDTADNAYLNVTDGHPPAGPGHAPRIFLVQLDPGGQLVDTIPEPSITGEPEGPVGFFTPKKVWGWSPLGYPVVGLSGRYSFEIRPPTGPLIRVEKSTPRIPLTREEKRQHESLGAGRSFIRGESIVIDAPPAPDHKPAYQTFSFSDAGNVWVLRHGPSGEPPAYDVFRPDGTFLGEARVPPRVSLMVFGEDVVWGIRRGEFDEPYVVRYRLTFPDSVASKE